MIINNSFPTISKKIDWIEFGEILDIVKPYSTRGQFARSNSDEVGLLVGQFTVLATFDLLFTRLIIFFDNNSFLK